MYDVILKNSNGYWITALIGKSYSAAKRQVKCWEEESYKGEIITMKHHGDINHFFPMNPKDLDEWPKVEELLNSDEWCLQMKRDGVRGIIHITESGCRIFGRKSGKKDKTRPLEMTHNLPTLAGKIFPTYMHGMALDCEIYHPEKTAAQLAGAVNPNRVEPPVDYEKDIQYWVFDLPIFHGEENPYNQSQRSTLLEVLFAGLKSKSLFSASPLRLVETITEDKEYHLQQWLLHGEEGGVLKRLNSPYLFSYAEEGKRSANTWVKAKKSYDGDFVITGFQYPEKYYTGKNQGNWTYWESIKTGEFYFGEIEGKDDKPLTKFAYYHWIGAIEYGLWMNMKDFEKYSKKNKEMRIIKENSFWKLVLSSIGSTSGFDEELRMKISQNPEKYLNQVVKISGMEQFSDTLAVRHPSVDMIRWDKDASQCELNPTQ